MSPKAASRSGQRTQGTKADLIGALGGAAGRLLFFFLLISPAFPLTIEPAKASETDRFSVVPERQVLQDHDRLPAWKLSWNQARDLVRSGQYRQAVPFYESLLLGDPGLHDARWELAQLLLLLGAGEKALPHLELLLEARPGRLDYARALADLLLAQQRFARASELYRLLLVEDARDKELLFNKAQSLAERDEYQRALPYVEQLAGLSPLSPGFPDGKFAGESIEESLARLYQLAGKTALSVPLLRYLADSPTAEPRLLILAAETLESLGLERQALSYWQRLKSQGYEHPVAAVRVEEYMVAEGQGEAALPYLLARKREEPENPFYLSRLVDIYSAFGRYDEALSSLGRLVELRPYDRRLLSRQIDLYRILGKEPEALIVLERRLALEGESAPEKLLEAARIYESEGELAKALELYPRILSMLPQDQSIVARKLRLLDALGREEDLEDFWQQAELRQQSLEVLEAWHDLDPENLRVKIALARLYAISQRWWEFEQMLGLLALSESGLPDELLVWRGRLKEYNSKSYLAWRDYEDYLRFNPQDRQTRRRAMQLAAELGLGGVVREHRRLLYEVDFQLAARDALVSLDAADHEAALSALDSLLYRELDSDEQKTIYLARAEIYADTGLDYLAEQQLRMALLLAESADIYAALLRLSLEAKRLDDARLWLSGLKRQLESGQSGLDTAELSLLEAELWIAEGEKKKATRLLAELAQQVKGKDESLLIRVVELLLPAGSLWLAEQLLWEELLACQYPPVEAFVLAARLSELRGRQSAVMGLLQRGEISLEDDPLLLLRMGQSLLKHGFYPQAVSAAKQVISVLPDSTSAYLLLADALAGAGESGQALDSLQEMSPLAASSMAVESRRLSWLLKSGRLNELLVLARRLVVTQPLLRERAQLKLFYAQWLSRHWQAAVSDLEIAIGQGINSSFKAAAQEQSLALPPDQPPDPLSRIAGKLNPMDEFLSRLMSPRCVLSTVFCPKVDLVENENNAASNAGFAGEKGFVDAKHSPGDQLRRLAAEYYADYRWQQRYTRELKARQAIIRGDFFSATRQLESLVQKYPDSQPLLYDLAGLYSRLDRLESEAAIYRQLAAERVSFPGLVELEERNRLKRRPRSSLAYRYSRHDGRDGYKNIRKQELVLSQWFSPRLGHSLELDLSRSFYKKNRDSQAEHSLGGRQASIAYKRDMVAGVDLQLGLGLFSDTDTSREQALWRFALSKDLGDRFRGGLALYRKLNKDTVEAIKKGISVDVLRAKGAVELLPRLEAGGGLVYRYFSDYNKNHAYDLWAAFIVFRDPRQLSVRYAYDFSDSKHGSAGLKPGAVPGQDFYPYWAPLNYWRKTIEINYRHQLSDDPLLRDVPRYYTLRYATVYDSEGYNHQQLGGSLFWEWRPTVIFAGDFDWSNSSRYRQRSLSARLIYRW